MTKNDAADKSKHKELNQQKALFLCGYFDPEREAVSKQIVSLSALFKSFGIYSLADYPKADTLNNVPVSKSLPHIIPLKITYANPRHHKLFYAFFMFIDKYHYAVSHIFYNLADDPFTKHLFNTRTIITCVNGEIRQLPRLDKIRKFVFESERDHEKFCETTKLGARSRIIYPGVNIEEWKTARSGEPQNDKFRILFASMPFTPDSLKSRGFDLLINAAKALGNKYEFVVLNRMPPEVLRANFSGDIPENVILIEKPITDIREVYKTCGAVVLPFRGPALNKSCPLSLVEGLAAGKPVIVTKDVGVSNIIAENSAGAVCDVNYKNLAGAIEEVKSKIGTYRENAVKCAEKYFSLDNCLSEYSKLYNEIIN